MKRLAILALVMGFCLSTFARLPKPRLVAGDQRIADSGSQPGTTGEQKPSAQDQTSLGENPYWVFVGFLYACVASDIAAKFRDAPYGGKSWEIRWSHLFLASFVLGTSFLAWSQAIAKGAIKPEAVLSWKSLLLIFDFWILILYFTYVAVVAHERETDRLTAPPDAHDQPSFWIAWIFTAYSFWDVVAFGIIPQSLTTFVGEAWMSGLCAVLAFVAFRGFKKIRAEQVRWVVWSDVSLIALILFFRALKQFHRKPDPWLIYFGVSMFAFFALVSYLSGRFGSRELKAQGASAS
jgi:hypothetical protein